MKITHIDRFQDLAEPNANEIAVLLAKSFAKDPLMLATLGKSRWNKIARDYFKTQIGYSDTLISLSQRNRTVGILLASSPEAQIRLIRNYLDRTKTAILLGKKSRKIFDISTDISEALPKYPHWYINQLAVDPLFQSKGIARTMLESASTEIFGKDVFVDCEKGLAPFYDKFGFEILKEFEREGMILMIKKGNQNIRSS